jgi:hypothetical protein
MRFTMLTTGTETANPMVKQNPVAELWDPVGTGSLVLVQELCFSLEKSAVPNSNNEYSHQCDPPVWSSAQRQ